jgi:hypothetical protein
MVRKLGELPKVLVLNSGIESFRNSSVSLFTYCCLLLYRFLCFLFLVVAMGLVMF